MRLAVVLAGAGVAAALLTAGAVVSAVQDPELARCATARDAMDAANSAHQDAMRGLEGRFRRGGAEAEVAKLRVTRAKATLDAARAEFELACHYKA